jgi:hypothetical protein
VPDVGAGVAAALVETHGGDEAVVVRAELHAHLDGRGVGLGRVGRHGRRGPDRARADGGRRGLRGGQGRGHQSQAERE